MKVSNNFKVIITPLVKMAPVTRSQVSPYMRFDKLKKELLPLLNPFSTYEPSKAVRIQQAIAVFKYIQFHYSGIRSLFNERLKHGVNMWNILSERVAFIFKTLEKSKYMTGLVSETDAHEAKRLVKQLVEKGKWILYKCKTDGVSNYTK